MKRTIGSIIAMLSFSVFADNNLPPRKPNLGVKKIICVAVQWTDNNRVNEENCGNMVTSVKNFYERNSRGKLKLQKDTGLVRMDEKDGPDKINKGANAATAKFPNYDYYIIPNTASNGPNHSGNRIAYMNQILDTVAQHESGHILGLDHAQKVDGCCDQESIMNPKAKESNFLTAPQYYYLGWMTNDEYVSYTAAGTFELKHPLDSNPGLASIIVSPQAMGHAANGRFAFISYSPQCNSGNACVAIHLANGGGSILVKEIAVGKSYYDGTYTGLDVAVSRGSTMATVKINVGIH